MVTSLTCICRIDKFDGNADSGSLVFYKLLQLVKAPSCYHAVKVFVPRLCLSSNVLKLFHAYYSAIVPFSLIDKLFRKNVVFMFNSSVFVTRKFFENFFCALLSFGLQACAHTRSFMLKLLPIRPINLQSCRSSHNILDSKINTHNATSATMYFLEFANNMDIPNSCFVEEMTYILCAMSTTDVTDVTPADDLGDERDPGLVSAMEIAEVRARQQAAVLAFGRRTNARPRLDVLTQDAVALVAEVLHAEFTGASRLAGNRLILTLRTSPAISTRRHGTRWSTNCNCTATTRWPTLPWPRPARSPTT